MKKHLKRPPLNNYTIREADKPSDFGFPYFTSNSGGRFNLIKTPSNIFEAHSILRNKEYEFAFTANSDFKEIKGSGYDPEIGKTIMRFIKNILDDEPNKIIIYNCSDSGGRRSSRARAFKRWYEGFIDSNKYHMANFNDDEYTYHFAVVLSKNNKYFDLFMKERSSFFA